MVIALLPRLHHHGGGATFAGMKHGMDAARLERLATPDK